MIGQLTGIVAEKQPPELLLEVAGVGYEVQLPMTSFYNLPEIGEQTTVFTHFVVREDAQLLFGFTAKQERQLFRELIKANGVGPKLALTILSGLSAEQFVTTVHQDDVAALVKLPGVGKKTAERLLVEMKDRLAKWSAPITTPNADALAGMMPVEDTFVHAANAEEEAVSALVALGYKPQQASRAVSKIAQDGMNSEELIRQALRSMA